MLTDSDLQDLLAYATHGTTTPRLVCRNTYAALLRECLASRAVVEAARRVVEGPIEGSQRALALLADEVMHMDGEASDAR